VGLSRRLQADLCIIGLSAIWGCTFVVIKRGLDDISPLLFITIRFSVAALPLYFMVPRGALFAAPTAGAGRGPLMGGAVTGVLLFTGFVLQTVGMQYTTPARSAFITGMYVIFTPLLSIALRLRRPSVNSFVGAALAVTGLFLLTNPGGAGNGFGYGEMLTLLGAIAFSGHLLAVDHYTRRFDRSAIAFLQVAAVGALGLLPTLVVEPMRFVPTSGLLVTLAVTSLLGTSLAFWVLNMVQAWTTPTRAAIIFAAEPVFAALTSWAVQGEVFRGVALAGAALILAGMLTAEIGPFARRRVEPAV
jgi:drug/metabolite transporter (DMT)-like permease